MTKNLSSLPLPGQFPSRKEWEKTCWKEIMKSGGLLVPFITSNERRNIVVRAVAGLVNSGKGPKQISEELQISRQTVSSIRKALKEGGYKSYRERGKEERKKKIYSHHPPKKPYRYYRRTKYGKVYMPYH